MRLKLSLFFTIGALSFTNFLAQSSNDIVVTVEGLGADTVFLANYYGSRLFYSDTTVADINGHFVFKGKPFDECGKYAVVLPGPVFFDMMLVSEPMEFRTTMKNPQGDMQIIQSEENKVFYDYLNFLNSKREERTPHDAVLNDSTASSLKVEIARNAMKVMNSEVLEYQDALIDDPRDYLFGKYLGMLREPQVPNAPSNVENVQFWNYMWYRNHYWDRVDFADSRLVRDGSFHKMIEMWWGQIIPPDPDTLFFEAQKLLAQVVGNEDMFKYILHHMTFESESSKVMCMDKVFVDLVNEYYVKGKVKWLDDKQLAKIVDRAKALKYSVCGNIAHNITLPGIDGTTWKSLHDIEAKYTVMVIWESSCGHCKKEMPVLQRIYEEWHDKGLEIYAIGNDFEPEPWLEYLETTNYTDWIHVSDNPLINAQDSAATLIYSRITDLESLNFRTTFDVFSTPKLFLLDENKKILAKQIGALQLAEMLYRLEGLEPPHPEFFLSEEAIEKIRRSEEQDKKKP
ncbi:MAG TPA: redoxin domain-containing protein [Flavobacteriales bacterium]|nr:redoxin domain-containing protein [Flavobacteriales bacterium]